MFILIEFDQFTLRKDFIMNTLFNTIDQLATTLKSLRPLNEAELKRLRGEFIIETTYNSNAIEGNTLTLRETALILQEGITIATKPLRDHLDVIGYRDAYYYILDLAQTDTPLTESVIKNIHSLVLMRDAENKGRYRSVPVRIMGAEHTPPQPYMVPVAMEQLVENYDAWQRNQHIIEAIARMHLEFETIHPFIDGNGRTGRLLMELELVKHGLLPIDIKFRDRSAYYDCFDSYRANDKNPEAMACLIANYEIEELKRYISIVKGKKE